MVEKDRKVVEAYGIANCDYVRSIRDDLLSEIYRLENQVKQLEQQLEIMYKWKEEVDKEREEMKSFDYGLNNADPSNN